MSRAKWEDIDRLIRGITYHGAKANFLIETSKMLVDEYGGRVPEEMEELTELPGIGRKIANVIRGNAFGKPAIIVDTHFKRVVGRLGLTEYTAPEKIERDLQQIVPQERWTRFSNLMLFHGRAICKAGRPLCPICPVESVCPFPNKTRKLTIAESAKHS